MDSVIEPVGRARYKTSETLLGIETCFIQMRKPRNQERRYKTSETLLGIETR